VGPLEADEPDTAQPAGRDAGPRRIPGPFSGRQLSLAGGVVLAAAAVLFALTRPIAPGSAALPAPLPAATPYLVGSPTTGFAPGDLAPELTVRGADGSPAPISDLSGSPVRLADLRGRLVLLNFWATWCPPCQGETPVLRDLDDEFRSRGLSIVGVAVQETTPSDVAAYAARYGLRYTIAFDATADVFRTYRVFALPTQVVVGPDGRVRAVVNGPLTDDGGRALLGPLLPLPAPTGTAPAGPAGSPVAPAAP